MADCDHEDDQGDPDVDEGFGAEDAGEANEG